MTSLVKRAYTTSHRRHVRLRMLILGFMALLQLTSRRRHSPASREPAAA